MIYRPVPGYHDLYAGIDGTIVSGSRGELTQTHPKVKEYPLVYFPSPCGGMTTVPVYRLVAAAFLGPQPPGMVTRHADGNRKNSHLSNLCYGTPSDNARDSVAHGTNHHARKTHCSKGHEFSPENTYTPPGTNYRQCSICRRFNGIKARGPLRGPARISDTQRAIVEELLRSEPALSSHAVGELAGVSHTTVLRLRRKLGAI